jgi:hexosaminidase
VLGLQGNLWTEWVHEAWHAELQLYPRLFAIAEVAWSQPSSRNWPDFQSRSDAWSQVVRKKGYTVYPDYIK